MAERGGNREDTGGPAARWGLAGAPLLPQTLRRLWAHELLPEWVGDDLNLPPARATVAWLDAGMWGFGGELTGRVHQYILNLVASRTLEFERLRVFEQPLPAGLILGQLPFAVRTHNALWRAGLIDDIERLNELTFGQLLALRRVGIATVLDAACTIEAAVNDLKQGGLVVRGLARDRVGADVTSAAYPYPLADLHPLDLARLMKIMGAFPYDEPIFDEAISAGGPPVQDGTADDAASAGEPSHPTPVSHHPRGHTVQSIDDELARADAEAAALTPSSIPARLRPYLKASIPEGLAQVLQQPWAHEVSSQDRRFRNLLPSGFGTIYERIDRLAEYPEMLLAGAGLALEERLPDLERELERIAGLPIERALSEYLSALSGVTGARLDGLAARLGIAGEPPITLQKAGDQMGVTRERVRQIQKRASNRRPSHPVFMPALDEALELARENAPVGRADLQQLLLDSRLTDVEFSPESLLAAAELCSRDVPELSLLRSGDRSLLAMDANPRIAREVYVVARRQSDASGASNVEDLAAELARSEAMIEPADAREILKLQRGIEFLDDDWFWRADSSPTRNRLRNVTRRMLAVASPIGVAQLRDGLKRAYKFRDTGTRRAWPLVVPPRSVLVRCYDAHPEFEIDEKEQVSSVELLDYREELAATERLIVDVLRSSPACLLDRASLVKGCLDRGANLNTISVYTTYSPIVEHVAVDVWSLRGVQVDPAAVEAVRRANALRARERRLLDHGWTPDGLLWVAWRLPEILGSMVLSVPAAVVTYLGDREFEATDEYEVDSGRLRILETGHSFGYSPFLNRRGGDEGDILIAEFDLGEGTATLKLGDDVTLDEMSPEP